MPEPARMSDRLSLLIVVYVRIGFLFFFSLGFVNIFGGVCERSTVYQGFSWLVIFETGRDGTALTGLAGKIVKTGRDGTAKIMKIIVSWM